MKIVSRPFPLAVFLGLSLAAAVRGQSLLAGTGFLLDALLFFTAAAGLLWYGVQQSRPIQLPAECADKTGTNSLPLVGKPVHRRRFLTGAIATAFLAYLGFGGNRLSGWGILFYVSSLLLFTLAMARRREPRPGSRKARETGLIIRLSSFHVGVLMISLLGLGMRLYDLEQIPGDMTSAHVEELLEVNGILSGRTELYFVRSTGREPLFLYLVGLVVKLTPLPIGFMALKLASVALGTLAIPLTSGVGRALFGRAAGIFAGLLVAFSHWHLTASRSGFQHSLTVTIAAAFLYFLVKGIRNQETNAWLMAGGLAGVGLLTSWSLWGLPLLLAGAAFTCPPAAASAEEPSREEEKGVRAPHLLAPSLLALVLVASPILHAVSSNPAVLSLQTLPAEGGGLSALFRNTAQAVLMFQRAADSNWIDSVPGLPGLSRTPGALLLIGTMTLAVWRTKRSGRLLLRAGVTLFALLLPGILQLGSLPAPPALAAAAGTLPVVCVISALPPAMLWGLRTGFRRPGQILILLLVGLIFVNQFQESRDAYFSRYAGSYRSQSWNSAEMGRVIRGFGDSVGDTRNAWIFTYPHWVDYRAVGIEAGSVPWEHLVVQDEWLNSRAGRPEAQLFLLHPEDRQNLQRIRSVFPRAELKTYRSKTPGKDFVTVFVPPGREPDGQGEDSTR